jgi:hypothetical protein
VDGADTLGSSLRDLEPPLLQGWLTKKGFVLLHLLSLFLY